MARSILHQIAQLPGLSKHQLLNLWLELYGKAAPPGIRRELMVPLLAYRMQEKAYGGLTPATRSKLLGIARALENAPSKAEGFMKPKIKPGTRIVREWRRKRMKSLSPSRVMSTAAQATAAFPNSHARSRVRAGPARLSFG
jgi:hypothetical protein